MATFNALSLLFVFFFCIDWGGLPHCKLKACDVHTHPVSIGAIGSYRLQSKLSAKVKPLERILLIAIFQHPPPPQRSGQQHFHYPSLQMHWITEARNDFQLRAMSMRQDSNLGLLAWKPSVLPLHHACPIHIISRKYYFVSQTAT